MVLVPVVALVALSLAVPAGGALSVRSAFLAVGVALLVLAGGRLLVFDEVIWPNSEVMRRCRWLARHLEMKKDWASSPVVLLTGSSTTMFGLDPERIERRLSEAGVPATVLSFSISGATLPERRYMLQSFLGMLNNETRRKLRTVPLVVLQEVFDSYDENPLYRVEKEAFSQRLIQFLNPENAWKAWQAHVLQCRGDSSLSAWPMALLLARHSLLNIFAVGSLSDMEWPGGKRRVTAPFFALEGHKQTFNYRETIGLLQQSADSITKQNSTLPLPQAKLSLAQMLEPLQTYPHHVGFYALPMLESHRVAYAKDLRRLTGAAVPFLGPPSDAELRDMLSAEFWFDGVHPTGKGAELFSDWFAKNLIPILSANEDRQH